MTRAMKSGALSLLLAASLPALVHADEPAPATGVTRPTIPGKDGPAFVYFVTAADVTKAMADAQAATKHGEAFGNHEPFLHLLFHAGPNMVSMENRPTGAPEFTLHRNVYELFYVLEGSGTLYTGGSLVNPKDYDPNDASSREATGGKEVKLKKGDVVTVPPSTVHRVIDSDGKLVLFTVHMPAVDGSVQK